MNKKQKPKTTQAYDVPVKGSLGLLALGFRGVQAWRKKRDEAEQETKK